MKKKLLFIAPDHYSFYKVVEDGFRKYTEYEIFTIISNGSYKYKNIDEKIKNFFMKTFLNKNLKIINAEKHCFNQVDKYKKYDTFFAIRPDILSEETLVLANKKSRRTIANFWDSFEKIKGQKETMPFFDICYSFDKEDCENFKMNKITNFYFNEEVIENPKFDVFFLGTFDDRFSKLVKVLENLNKFNINARATVFTYFKNIAIENSNKFVDYIHEIVPFQEAVHYSQNTKIVLDIQHDNQVGLSFRPFEAMGLKKKLITTNENIRDYDFYRSNNIFIWTENTETIPEAFFKTPYENLPKEIYEKYSLKNWVKTILAEK